MIVEDDGAADVFPLIRKLVEGGGEAVEFERAADGEGGFGFLSGDCAA